MDEKQLQVKEKFEDNDVIDLVELFYVLRRNVVFLILAAILGGLLGGIGSYFFITPTYQATAKVYVVSASSDSVVNLSDLQLGSSLALDYEQLVLVRPMLESVLENLNLQDELSTGQLKSMITITNPADTRILELTVTSPDPVQAADIANELSELAINWLPEVMETSTPNLAEEAIVPSTKAGPNNMKNALMGAVALLVVCCGVILVRHLMDNTIRGAEDLERYFGLTPLTVIYEEKGKEFHDSAPKHNHQDSEKTVRGGKRQKGGNRG